MVLICEDGVIKAHVDIDRQVITTVIDLSGEFKCRNLDVGLLDLVHR